MVQEKARIIYNKEVCGRYFHIAFESRIISKESSPGQFVEIRVLDGLEPLLRRPFSIHCIEGRNVEILYEVVGRGSQILSQKKAGEYLDIIGPLGNGFNYGLRLPVGKAGITDYACLSPACRTGRARQGLRILVAGGMGVAPLIFLAEKLAQSKSQRPMVRLRPSINSPSALSKVEVPKSRILALVGAKTKRHILCEKEFRKYGCAVKIATDDGSCGFKGKVTNLLKDILLTIDHRPSTIYACGPKSMLAEICKISKQYSIPSQISLEAHMTCGIGACLGCVVDTVDGYKRVCKEGPVFDADEIVWTDKEGV